MEKEENIKNIKKIKTNKEIKKNQKIKNNKYYWVYLLSDKSIDVNAIKNLYNTLNAKNNTSNEQLEVYAYYKLFELNNAINSKNNKIMLLNLLPLQQCDIYAPFLYVVDEFNQLNNIENRKWYKLRKNKNDTVLSLNENKILNLKEILEKYA